MEKMLNVCIVGAGSLGCLFATRFAASSRAAVTLVQRFNPEDDAKRKVVLKARELNNSIGSRNEQVLVSNGLQNMPASNHIDVVLVLVKNKDTQEVADGLVSNLKSNAITSATRVVTLQNGVGNLEIIRDTMSKKLDGGLFFQGLTYTGAVRTKPFQTEHRGVGKTFIACKSHDDPVLDQLQAIYNETKGIVTEEQIILSENANALVWTKLLVNTIINPLSAILNDGNKCITEPRIQKLVQEAAREFELVASMEGQTLDFGKFGTGAEFVTDIALRTGPNISSMLADIRANRETEIEYFNGFVVKTAEKHGLKIPVQESLYHLVNVMQRSK